MDFVALDFETANSRRSSPCSAALVRFRDGQPVDSWYQLMRPPAGHDEFSPMNVSIHGITEADVAGKPRFGDWWPSMAEFIGADVVVAHNAAFDLSVLRASLVMSELALPDDLPYACTLRTSKVMLDLLSYSLPWVAVELDVPFTDHHNAAADALAAGQVMVALMQRAGVTSIPELYDQQRIRLRTLAQMGQPIHRRGPEWVRTEVDRANLDPDHPLFDRVVVFTGGLDRLTRAEAWDEVAAVGGIPGEGVTKRTNVLVIGPAFFAGEHLAGDQMTGKMAKAAKLKAKGQDIEVMSEREFYELLPGWEPAPRDAVAPETSTSPTPPSAASPTPSAGPVTLSSAHGVEVSLAKGENGIEVSFSFSGAEWEEQLAQIEQEEARRDAARTPEQRIAWAQFQATWRTSGDPAAIDQGAWPDGHPDLVEIAEYRARRTFQRFDEAGGQDAREQAARELIAATEALGALDPVASPYNDAHMWLSAVVALPPEEARERFRIDYTRRASSLTYIDALERRLVDPSGRVTRPQTALEKLHEATPWLELFLDLGFTVGYEALAMGLITLLGDTGLEQEAAELALDAHSRGSLPAKYAVRALNAADRYQQAADLGREAITRGVVDVGMADRLGIIYERHLDDLESALWVSETALSWPLEYPGSKIEAIRKRRIRVQKRLTAPPPPAPAASGITEELTCRSCGSTFTRTRTRGRKPHECPSCR